MYPTTKHPLFLLKRLPITAAFLCLFSCGGGGTDSGSNSSIVDTIEDADFDYLFKHNAYRLNGLTARWPTQTITVSGANSKSWQKAIRRWPAINFRFVASDGDINIRYFESNDWCGNAISHRTSAGTIDYCEVQINRKIEISRNRTCRDHRDVVMHEVGHCIGFFRHTSDGGIMDATVGADQTLTRPVRDMINLLYSLPPGTDIKHQLSVQLPINANRIESVVVADREVLLP